MGDQEDPAKLKEIQTVNTIREMLFADKDFNEKYIANSLFVIGAGAFGVVFQVVTQASGSDKNTKYPEELVKYLQKIRGVSKVTKKGLIDSYRSNHCLDLVAMKVEHIDIAETEDFGLDRVALIKEFYIMQYMFRKAHRKYAMIGFPMPIDFGYLGKDTPPALDTTMIYTPEGKQASYLSTYVDKAEFFNIKPHKVTTTSYLCMEMIGPNLDTFKNFYKNTFNKKRCIFTVQTVLKLMDQVLCRLLVMHRLNVVHYDMKPDNICVGVEKMMNTIYLMDFGLSRICSTDVPIAAIGSRRYMSVKTMEMKPANYIMDIESWFYILIVLLNDEIPWSDEALNKEKFNINDEPEMREAVLRKKMELWNDRNTNNDQLLLEILEKLEENHGEYVPDVQDIFRNIYTHVQKMRLRFYNSNFEQLNESINDESGDLFKQYKRLRKLLLHPYDAAFSMPDLCFDKDAEFYEMQAARKKYGSKLIYVEDGRDWKWDWDEWFTQMSKRNAGVA